MMMSPEKWSRQKENIQNIINLTKEIQKSKERPPENATQ